MSVRERILAIRLLERMETYRRMFEEMGVSGELLVRKNDEADELNRKLN